MLQQQHAATAAALALLKKSFKRNVGRTGHMNGGGFGEAKNHGIVKLQVVGKTRDQSARNDRK